MTLFFPFPTHTRLGQLDQGVDIAAPAHTPLIAIGSGVIVRHGISGFGADTPILKLDSGEYVYYGHAGPGHRLREGTRVKAGDTIGEVGAGIVGISTGPHLEIGFADARGNPLGRQTAAKMKQWLDSSLSVTTHRKEAQDQVRSTGILGTGIGPDVGADFSPGSGAHQKSVTDLPGSIVNAIFDALRKDAAYAFLAVVLVLGGFALAGVGVSKALGARKPQEQPA